MNTETCVACHKCLKLPEIIKILKSKNIKGIAHLNKPELLEKLKELSLYNNTEELSVVKEPNVKFERLKYIRNQPKGVEILDRETGILNKYSSMYKAAQSLGQNAGIIFQYDGKVWRDRYEIKIDHNKFPTSDSA